jgi:hypothetical protein
VSSRFSALVGSLVLSGFVALGVYACSPPPDATRVTVVDRPDFNAGFASTAQHAGVSTFLERRCGTLDCHGQLGRPLRIYGARGLRLVDEAGNVPGGNGTTPAEEYANYQATIAVQPEMMLEVENEIEAFAAADASLPDKPWERLLLVRKPRQMERHKGGAVIVAGDPGDTCLVSWIEGNVDRTACDNASSIQN